jgi:hypothetical protein
MRCASCCQHGIGQNLHETFVRSAENKLDLLIGQRDAECGRGVPIDFCSAGIRAAENGEFGHERLLQARRIWRLHVGSFRQTIAHLRRGQTGLGDFEVLLAGLRSDPDGMSIYLDRP